MMNHALRSGAIVGVISIVISLLIYIIDVTIFANWWISLVILLINLVIIAYFGLQYRKEVGGFLTFKNAYVYSFMVFIAAGVIGIVFQILLYTVIDPDVPEIITEAAIENTEKMLQNFGTPQETIDESIRQMEKDMPEQFTVLGMIKSFGYALIFYAIFSLITGAIIKKKEPEFEG